jgi:ankyrin repeat protein
MVLEALLPHQVMEAATRNGHKQIVKLLLDKGADVNAQGGGYGNALHAASVATSR